MNPWVTRIAAETAAGSGVEALVAALCVGRPLASPAPWAWPEVPGLGVALVNRSRGGSGPGPHPAAMAGSATALLHIVVSEVLPDGPCGLVVGTSSGDVCGPFEAGDGGPDDWRQRPTHAVAAQIGPRLAPLCTVSVACASGAAAFDVARGWLRSGRCQRVIVAGVDPLSRFIHAGFAGLGALAAGASRPFTEGRDGLMLGEGAAAVLLETPESARAAGRTPLCALRGTGLSQDAVHLTAPDRTGGGLYRAARAALADAGIEPGEVGLVSAHGTGTVFNDAMEARALSKLFGGRPVPLHAAKPVIGHTLGAAGTVEAVALIAMMAGADTPAPIACDPDLGLALCGGGEERRWGLSVNSAFGGVNTALVFGPVTPSNHGLGRQVNAGPTLNQTWDAVPVAALPKLPDGTVPLNLGRADLYARAGIMALHAAGARTGDAVVLTSLSNCVQADTRYRDALNQRGPAAAPRVQFIYTVPGAPLAEAAILLGLTGPGLVLCESAEVGAEQAQRWVAEGRADRVIALHIEAPSPDVPARTTSTVYTA